MKYPKNKQVILGYYFLAITGLGLILLPFYKKGEPELVINALHHPFFDAFFSMITHLGDGVIPVFFLGFIIFNKYCYLALLTFATIIHLGLVHLGKKWLFHGMPRPAEFFKDIPFYNVPGVELHHWGSFPSGHSTTAFMLASFLFLIVPKRSKVHTLIMMLAFLVAFSRVYLMQHFLVDIWAGALLGISSSLVSYYLVLKFFSKKVHQKSILQDLKIKPSF